eukprot:Hpha_TRINITY_DN15316_c6_g8::TRINITY_DN15316_c6_g8_i1::g.90002::m.90002
MAGGEARESFDYWVVLDFEATCDNPKQIKPQEIIEFPMLLVNARTGQTEATFHHFIRPAVNPTLTEFCTGFTGIRQEQTDAGLDLVQAVKLAGAWFRHHRLGRAGEAGARSFIVCTCGDWDMGHLKNELKRRKHPVPFWAKEWCNVKRLFTALPGTGDRAPGMKGMLEHCGVPLDGHHHSGIDDSRNIAKLVSFFNSRGQGAYATTAEHGSSPSAQGFRGPSNEDAGVVPRDCTRANLADWPLPVEAEAEEPAAAPARRGAPATVGELLDIGPVAENATRAAGHRDSKGPRSDRAKIAHETVAILKAGEYINPSETKVQLADSVKQSVEQSVHIPAAECLQLPPSDAREEPVRLEVRHCTVLTASQDLAEAGCLPGVLNFASSRNPGGGFFTGAEAQEESIARASALYPCLTKFMGEFFEGHRRAPSGEYTHAMIFSPRVPVFRDTHGALLERPYSADFLTAAAPNMGVLWRQSDGHAVGQKAMQERIRRVLTLFAQRRCRTVVLGAWGCGVFKNSPDFVADCFAKELTGSFRHHFSRAVFAILDPDMAAVFADRFRLPIPEGCALPRTSDEQQAAGGYGKGGKGKGKGGGGKSKDRRGRKQ